VTTLVIRTQSVSAIFCPAVSFYYLLSVKQLCELNEKSEQVQQENMFKRQTLMFHFSTYRPNSCKHLSHHMPVFQCYDTVGWVIFHWPVKSSPKWPIILSSGTLNPTIPYHAGLTAWGNRPLRSLNRSSKWHGDQVLPLCSFFPCRAGSISCLVLRPPNGPNARPEDNTHLT